MSSNVTSVIPNLMNTLEVHLKRKSYFVRHAKVITFKRYSPYLECLWKVTEIPPGAAAAVAQHLAVPDAANIIY